MGIRIIKTALAAIAAIYTAVYFGLEPPLGAGILAILGVEVTRMKGLKSAFVRFIASVLGLFFASLIFTVFGFHIWAVAVFILITFPVLSRFQLKDGIVTSSVIVFHLFDSAEVTTHVIGNEVMLLLAGLGWATIVNIIYMPKDEHRLTYYREAIERSFGVIFKEMAITLRNPSHVWNGSEILEAHQAIEEGAQRSVRNRENRLWGQEQYWSTYFEMRRQQLESVQQMLVELAFVYEKFPQAAMIAELLEQLPSDVKSDVYQGSVEERLYELAQLFRTMELPKTRDEFEVRAALHMLLHELERYLGIAKRLKKRKVISSDLQP
ncbi:aromatic acid exporter family protein [Paenibacillus alkaliterrae]|uniref:aromatic acid exporter family protein n=1 Tax=Paenibacillus alkaliterrae TaxID=320909 RepID=UPI001F1B485C|nr:aromatic acid exporter family protein [Paenibacillus alkaliterrae]MCF2938321.1 aromatic acid exporter family protein [Paenibacillus alkaliterrae]